MFYQICLFNFCSSKARIEFFDVPDLYKCTFSVTEDKYKPGKMCTGSPKELLYEDLAYLGTLEKLECSKLPLLREQYIQLTESKKVRDLCYVKDENNKAIMVCLYDVCHEIFAQELENGGLIWKLQGAIGGKLVLKLVSITTDNRGHIFACDTANECIQLFSTTGIYVGCFVAKGQHGIKMPKLARWCNKSSSLIVIHSEYINRNKDHYYISVLKT